MTTDGPFLWQALEAATVRLHFVFAAVFQTHIRKGFHGVSPYPTPDKEFNH